jgi:hypothetical protein
LGHKARRRRKGERSKDDAWSVAERWSEEETEMSGIPKNLHTIREIHIHGNRDQLPSGQYRFECIRSEMGLIDGSLQTRFTMGKPRRYGALETPIWDSEGGEIHFEISGVADGTMPVSAYWTMEIDWDRGWVGGDLDKGEEMSEKSEQSYLNGQRSAYLHMLSESLKGLGYKSAESREWNWVLEREEALAQLRINFPDAEFDSELHLADIIRKYIPSSEDA